MTPATINAAINMFLPALISFLKKEHLPNIFNAVVALITYVIAALFEVVVINRTSVTIDSLVPTIATVIVMGTSAYQLFWKNYESNG